ncbi:MAG: hypothetical protein QOD86_1029 [Miltoncostaeaceae bacterium]|nr:hypothetical protein [Miltoncostaeaceae bacterium]
MAHPVFQVPTLNARELRVCDTIQRLREEVGHQVREPRRWVGQLRRMTLARAVQGSNSIEGYAASLDDVLAVEGGEEPLEASRATAQALAGYQDAMTYVLQLAQDPDAGAVDEGLLKSLHFMMLKHELAKNPGRWRPGAIFVRREPRGQQVYEGPPHERIPALLATMLGQIEDDGSPVLVRAAMAHLNLMMIHPFSDGNGRMGRALQTLVLARDRIVAPVFSSIEEYLGRNAEAYYEVLEAVGQGSWHPENDARPWVRFCLTAHHRQVRTLLRRIQTTEHLWTACFDLTQRLGLPERMVGPLSDAAQGLRIRRAGYIESVLVVGGDEIAPQSATRDLAELVARGLFVAHGERRGRIYTASDRLREIWLTIRAGQPPRADEDPFEDAGAAPGRLAGQLSMDD